jgi:hypothetical protein
VHWTGQLRQRLDVDRYPSSGFHVEVPPRLLNLDCHRPRSHARLTGETAREPANLVARTTYGQTALSSEPQWDDRSGSKAGAEVSVVLGGVEQPSENHMSASPS